MDARIVVARYRLAQEEQDEAAMDAMVDYWLDQALEEFEGSLEMSERSVENALLTKGVSADKLNEVFHQDTNKESAGGIRALGGFLLKTLWHMVIGPFVSIAKFIKSSAFRNEVKLAFKRALKHEVRSTKHMVSVAGRLMRGEEVNPQERKAAMMQFVDIFTKVLLAYLTGPHIAHMFSGSVWKVIGTFLSPLDEILAVLLDKPIRAAAKKLLGSDLGMLPSGFYTHF